jgi:hypothetical protein
MSPEHWILAAGFSSPNPGFRLGSALSDVGYGGGLARD